MNSERFFQAANELDRVAGRLPDPHNVELHDFGELLRQFASLAPQERSLDRRTSFSRAILQVAEVLERWSTRARTDPMPDVKGERLNLISVPLRELARHLRDRREVLDLGRLGTAAELCRSLPEQFGQVPLDVFGEVSSQLTAIALEGSAILPSDPQERERMARTFSGVADLFDRISSKLRTRVDAAADDCLTAGTTLRMLANELIGGA